MLLDVVRKRLRARSREKHYVLGTRAYFCDHPNDNAVLSEVRIYFRDQQVSGNAEILNPGPSGLFTYSTYIGVARQAVTPSNPPEVSYDLRQHPEDIFFYVSGGNTSPFGFKSNVVTLPKEAIATALVERECGSERTRRPAGCGHTAVGGRLESVSRHRAG